MRTRSRTADLLAAPQPEADATECDEEGAQRSSQEWESGVRERGARADAARPCCGGAADATCSARAAATSLGAGRARGAGGVTAGTGRAHVGGGCARGAGGVAAGTGRAHI